MKYAMKSLTVLILLLFLGFICSEPKKYHMDFNHMSIRRHEDQELNVVRYIGLWSQRRGISCIQAA